MRWPRFRLRTLLILVALVGGLLGLHSWIYANLVEPVCWDPGPQAEAPGRESSLYLIHSPYLQFAIASWLSIIVVWPKTFRRLIEPAIAVNLFALLSWVMMRRAVASWAGGLCYWPDDLSALLELTYSYNQSDLHRWVNVDTFLTKESYISVHQMTDVFSLLACLLLLVRSRTQPAAFGFRVKTAIVINGLSLLYWVVRMRIPVGLAGGNLERLGLSPLRLHASWGECAEGLFLVILLAILARAWIAAKTECTTA